MGCVLLGGFLAALSTLTFTEALERATGTPLVLATMEAEPERRALTAEVSRLTHNPVVQVQPGARAMANGEHGGELYLGISQRLNLAGLSARRRTALRKESAHDVATREALIAGRAARSPRRGSRAGPRSAPWRWPRRSRRSPPSSRHASRARSPRARQPGSTRRRRPTFERGERERASAAAELARARGAERDSVVGEAARTLLLHELTHSVQVLTVVEQKLLPAAREVAEGQRKRLEAQEATTQDWVLARRAVLRGELDVIRARHDHVLARFLVAEAVAPTPAEGAR